MAYSGKFCPINKNKYIGDWKKITWRSSWEYTFLKHLDANPNVVKYSYETVIIPYISTADHGKKRRYYMDFYVKYNNGLECLVEVKPHNETMRPKPPKLLTEKRKTAYSKKAYTYQVNQDKWDTARRYCTKRNWKFFILTEKNASALGLSFGGVKK